jgi:lipoic acid synthetase
MASETNTQSTISPEPPAAAALQAAANRPAPGKPAWLKAKIPGGEAYSKVRAIVLEHNLNTVCQSASCPNLGECWSKGTATFMILGNTCTRGCRFCDVPKGRPGEYDRAEPARVADSVRLMGLKYAVITSVARDDLSDQGAAVWAETIRAAREAAPKCRIEVLIPDMQGNLGLVDRILEARPDILNHNFETVPRLQRSVRGRGNIADSSAVLTHAKARGFLTKTSLMLGLGETLGELREMIDYIASLKVDILTMGQYLQPSRGHLPVQKFVPPEEFEALRVYALENGVRICVSAPMVRSSYNADQQSAPLFASARP